MTNKEEKEEGKKDPWRMTDMDKSNQNEWN